MKNSRIAFLCAFMAFTVVLHSPGGDGEVPFPGAVSRFAIEVTDMNLGRPARPSTYFDKVGRTFGILGSENGSFEAWAYPLKILRGFEFSFLIGSSTVPIAGRDIVRTISVEPASTTLSYTFQSFTVRAHYVASIHDPGAVILLEIDSVEPLTVVCSFIPVLQPMWPAGLGGQYAYWDRELRAYLISEPTRKNHGYVGSPAAKGVSYTPAHMLSDSPNQFKIEIADPEAVRGAYLPVVLAGGKGRREDVRTIYRKIADDPEAVYREAVSHYRRLRDTTLRIVTPDPQINLAFEWAKVSYDNLLIDNPDLGLGIVAGLGPSGTGGRPGFGWYFGGDAYLNSLSLNSLGAFGASREALAFTRKWQREDGKMAHELSQAAGYLDWWGDYPYGYIHGDTTPYYIVAVEDYFRSTGDLGFVRDSWESILGAFDWCLTTDEDGDGLMDNSKAGLGALEFGALTGIRTDIYLAAVWAKACEAMRTMAEAVGETDVARKAADLSRRARSSFDTKFWDSEKGQYAYAFTREAELVPELTPWSSVGLAWDLGSQARSVETLARMNSPDLTTDWGIRMLSVKSPLFEPLNYNYGAAWPFLTGWVGAALYHHGFVHQGYLALMSSVRHTFDNALGCVTELFSGFQNIWPQEAVPHQGFGTSGVVYPLVRGLLGIERDAVGKRIVFAPRLPADWAGVSVSNLRLGENVLSVECLRNGASYIIHVRSEKAVDCRAVIMPSFGLGTGVVSASLNGRPLDFVLEHEDQVQAVVPRVEFALSSDDKVEITLVRAPEIVPPAVRTETGSLNKGLKIVRTEFSGRELRVLVEGLAGEGYDLTVTNGDLIESVSGAEYGEGRLAFSMPSGVEGEFSPHTIILTLKKIP